MNERLALKRMISELRERLRAFPDERKGFERRSNRLNSTCGTFWSNSFETHPNQKAPLKMSQGAKSDVSV
jgi:hypothetical protein